ncbi:glutathione S-transferase [Humitalea sp. 24SJ18S-53]|uniref:glutathione S-transferase n=1 Tax=Humitalea sp. 24SJ18S-53 TaxID=3422307 RepID=UPI003D675C34
MARLLISSRNYSSWSLRGFLLVRLSGLACTIEALGSDDPDARRELLLRASSIRIPRLEHDGLKVWDTLAIAEYLNETFPDAAMLPSDRAARAHCRSLCGEMHAGFTALRGSLPMNLKAHRPGFPVWSGAQSDIDRITEMWRDCLATHGGPWLFGTRRTTADAMFAPVATRILTYDVKLDPICTAYCRQIMTWPDMAEWVAEALVEPEEIEELEVEF